MNQSRKKTVISLLVLSVVCVGTILFFQKPNQQVIGATPSTPTTIQNGEIIPSSEWVDKVASLDRQGDIEWAKARGRMMRALIRSNPEQAILEALTLSEWSALPPEVQAHVEQPFSSIVNVEVMVACGAESSETSISTELPTLGNMETYVYGHRKEMGSKNSIPVQGIRVGKVGALREEIFQPLEKQDELAALELYPVVTEKPGGHAVAALAGGKLFYFKSRAELEEANTRLANLDKLPCPESGSGALFQDLEAAMIGGEIDFQALEEIVMKATAAWTGTPRDMYVVMVDFPDNTGQPADPVTFSNSLNTTVSQQIWDMSYEKTHIVATVNANTYRMPNVSSYYTNKTATLFTDARDLAIAGGADLSSYETICVLFKKIDSIWWAGLASINGERLWLNGTTNTDVVIHELGHNYGSYHASFWEVSGFDPVDPSGTPYEYGDFMDIMGGGDAPEGHFNAWHKNRISWFDADNWQSVSNSGTYRVYRSDHRQTTGLVRGLEIDKGAGDYYWVGIRQEYADYETFSRGAYLLWKKSGDGRSYLLDTSPQSVGGVLDGGLALGQTYSDAAAGVHITAVDRGGPTPNEWLDVAVNLGTFPGNTVPTASLSAPSNIAVQTSTLLSVSASDADGDELAYYWDTGDGLVKPNAASISAAWLSGGTNTISCVVSDMKGGTNRVSQTVVVSSPLESWTKRTTGTTAQLNDIAYGNGRLVAVGRDWKIVYSDDGVNWTVFTFGYPYAPYFEGVVFDGSLFVAVGLDYDGAAWGAGIYTSTDGASWTRRYTGGSALNDVAFGNGSYVAVGGSGTILRSTDGLSWSPVTSGTTTDLRAVGYGEGTFVAVGDAGNLTPHVVLTSTDGSSWSDQSAGVQMYAGNWLFAVEYCNDRFLAGGWNSEIFGSTNQGSSFDYYLSGALDLESFAFGNGNYFAAGRDIGNSYADINLVSVDGENWVALATPDQDDRNAAIYYNGTFITVGDNGSIWQSDSVGSIDPGFAMWQLENGAVLGLNRDPLDDADFDGHLNLAEYAMGTGAADAGSKPASVMLNSGTYFQVSYERDGMKSDIDYVVERGVNLVSNEWNSAGTLVLVDNETNLTARSTYTMSSQTNEFMRLKLELK